jgi:SAM-dependent methyltransferase
MAQESPQFPKEYFQRYDESTDFNFYSVPRKVVHIDNGAIAALSAKYAELLPTTGAYLDLMSSWRSHLPDNLTPERVAGLGMNGAEMADNPQLTEYVVHSLNDNPRLPYDDATFDAALCAVSVQYLTNPTAVFADVGRVLQPGAPFVVSFSNRCFPTKAVNVWLSMSDAQHVALVTRYFELAGDFTAINSEVIAPGTHDPLYVVWGHRAD